MRIVITGALGHIGSRLIHALQPGEFDEVVLLDDLSTQRYCSLFSLPTAVPFRFVAGDVLTADLAALLDGGPTVIHLAAVTTASGPGDDARMTAVNVEGTARVAAACARAGGPLFMPSTTSVYGATTGTVDEDCPAGDLRPQSAYAAGKLRAEQVLQQVSAAAGLRYSVGRFGTIYDTSVGMRFDTAINKFCWQASLGQPLSVWRTAMEQARPYLDLDDAVRAIRFVLARDLFDRRVYNVVSQNATVREVVELIREVVPDVQVESVESPIMNRLSYLVSGERLAKQGFECRGDLREGIRRTLALLEGLRRSRRTP